MRLVSDFVTCSNCGAENEAGQRFCGSCGTTLARTCPACASRVPVSFQFCGNCGGQLDPAVAAEPAPAREVPRRAEERRLATVLFADISGFTNLSERMDPEEVHSLVTLCMGKLTAIAERYGGYVDKVIGDELMAVYGVPKALGDDAARAVRAALEMQRCAEENAGEFGGLALRVGVNTGEVMFAPVEAGGKETVIGDAVNTAKRIETAAPPGKVLVGSETYRASRGVIRYEAHGEITVKGKEEPLEVWLALGAQTASVERAAYAFPLIGREVELEQLRLVWETVSTRGRPHLVTLFGSPGIGKTRLATAFLEHVELEGGLALRGRSIPYAESTGFEAFGQQVKELAAVLESDPAARAREKLEQAVAELLPPEDASTIASHLAVLIGLGTEGAADRDGLFRSARRFVEALGRSRPTLLVFEDVHWADRTLLDLVDDLERAADVPLLVLALARPELTETRPDWAARWQRRHRHLELALDPLTLEESRKLTLRVLGRRAESAADGIVDQLGATAEGNPLFIEELAAHLVEHATDSVSRLPTTVKGIIAARLDALPDEERAVILSASVVGKVFWRGALERLGGDPARLPEILDSLCERDFIRHEPATSFEGDEEYSFKNILIREVAYATLPKRERRERHAAVARFVEAGAADRVEESAAVLAHHWRESGEPRRAADYLLTAAEQAGRARAKGKAEELFAEALKLIPEEEVGRWRGVLLQRALLWVELGAYQDAIAELDPLLPDLEDRRRFDALLARAQASFWLADADAAGRYGDEARSLAEALGDEEARAEALGFLAAATSMRGDVEGSVELGDEALRFWPPGTRSRKLAPVYEWASIENYWLGRYETSIERARSSYELGKEFHHVAAWVNGGAHLGLALTGLGRHEEALTVFEHVAAEGRDLELQPRFTARLTNMWAGTLRELHDLEAAARLNEEAVEFGERVKFPGAEISGKIDLLACDLMAGEIGKAETVWPSLWERAEATKGWHGWLWIARLSTAKAEIELGAGRVEQAAEQAAWAAAHADKHRRFKYSIASRLVLVPALLALGRRGEALEAARRAVADAEQLRHPQSLWRSVAALSQALAATGDDNGAEEAFDRARTALEAFASGLSPERRERFLAAPAVADILALVR